MFKDSKRIVLHISVAAAPLRRGAQTVTRYAGIGLPDDHSELEPPDPFSNSAVKRFSADGSVGSPHVRVGHRQVLYENPA